MKVKPGKGFRILQGSLFYLWWGASGTRTSWHPVNPEH